MVIDTSYFQQGDLYIPNAQNVDASSTGGALNSKKSKLQLFIDRLERELLMNALGVTLYDELVAILKANTLEEAGNEKWEALVNGENYTYNDKTYRWDGLRGYEQQSLVAAFVFCKYLKDDDTAYSTVGTVRDTAKNASSVSATPKYIANWNKFINAYQGDVDLGEYPKILTNASGEIGLSYFAEGGLNRSLYQYLSDKNNLDDTHFTDFEFKVYKRKNSMGI